MSDFKDVLHEVENAATRDLGTAIAFRDLLEALAWYLDDIDQHARQQTRTADIVIIMLLLCNMLFTVAIYILLKA